MRLNCCCYLPPMTMDPETGSPKPKDAHVALGCYIGRPPPPKKINCISTQAEDCSQSAAQHTRVLGHQDLHLQPRYVKHVLELRVPNLGSLLRAAERVDADEELPRLSLS